MSTMNRPLSAILTLPVVAACVVFSLFSGHFIPFSAFLVSLVACCFLYALGSRFGIGLEIQAPSRVLEGDRIDLSLLLNTRRRFPRFVSMSVAEMVAPADDNGRHTAAGRRSARRRKHKLFYQPPGASAGGTHAADGRDTPESEQYRMDGFILFRGRTRIHRELELPRRGVIRFECLKLRFSDPLGVFALQRTWRIGHEILVRIKPPPGGSALQITGGYGRFETHKRVGETGDMTEYAGTRPYRPGDELRHLHWPTVARTGELYVREYTPTSAESVVVLLVRNPRESSRGDGGGGTRLDGAGEAMLKANVALIMALFDRRIDTAFGCNIGRDGFAVDIGYSQRNLQRFHDFISAISWDETIMPDAGFAEALAARAAQTPMVIVFAVEAPDPDVIASAAERLRVERGQVTVVVPASMQEARKRAAPVAAGWRVVQLDPAVPESIFRALTL